MSMSRFEIWFWLVALMFSLTGLGCSGSTGDESELVRLKAENERLKLEAENERLKDELADRSISEATQNDVSAASDQQNYEMVTEALNNATRKFTDDFLSLPTAKITRPTSIDIKKNDSITFPFTAETVTHFKINCYDPYPKNSSDWSKLDPTNPGNAYRNAYITEGQLFNEWRYDGQNWGLVKGKRRYTSQAVLKQDDIHPGGISGYWSTDPKFRAFRQAKLNFRSFADLKNDFIEEHFLHELGSLKSN